MYSTFACPAGDLVPLCCLQDMLKGPIVMLQAVGQRRITLSFTVKHVMLVLMLAAMAMVGGHRSWAVQARAVKDLTIALCRPANFPV